jgi:sugar O-acyltransferase (sialic acid O-acetyltransferase NeuD family)
MYLYGASGHAKVIIDSLKASGINISGLFDDNPTIKNLLGYMVFGYFDKERLGNDELIISVGLNNIRKKITEKLPRNINYGKAIHPLAIISEYASIDKGTVVMQNAVIQTCATIGRHCIINTAAVIEHDCIVEDFVHISPNATLCGNVQVDEGAWIGAGTTIIQGVKIGKWAVIGAGSMVVKNIPDNVIAYGNPCRYKKY